MPNTTGLVSISFRKHSPSEILQATANAGLQLIEWGGDVHLPHGDLAAADAIRAQSARYGVGIAEYGSYYIIGQSEPALFTAAAATARRLGVGVIRVWPGMNLLIEELTGEPSPLSQVKGWPALRRVTGQDYLRMVADAQRICDEAADLTIALECHPASLTESYSLAVRFLRDVGRENLKMMWQPNQLKGIEDDLRSIEALLPWIVGVHVFAWDAGHRRYPLAQHEKPWRARLELLRQKELNYMLEFMPDDRLESLAGEAGILNQWIRELTPA